MAAGCLFVDMVPVVAGGTLLCGTAGDELVAARFGLTREWVVQIPFDSAGWGVESVAIGDGLIVAMTGDGGVHAVSTAPAADGMPRPGTVVWSRHIGRPGGPGQPAGIGDDIVAVSRDLDIWGLARDDGDIRWQKGMGHPASGSSVSVGEWVYQPVMSDGMMRLPKNPWKYAEPSSDGGSKSVRGTQDRAAQQKLLERLRPISIDAGGRIESSPVAYEGGIVWATEAGVIVGIIPEGEEWLRLHFDLQYRLAGPIVVRGPAVYAATARGDLVRIEDHEHKDTHQFDLVWHEALPFAPDSGPLEGSGIVVVSLGSEGLIAYASDSGEERWRSCVTGTPVAIMGDRVWLLDTVGRLSSVDVATGMPAEWLCMGPFTVPVVNTVDHRLILASPDGLLVSLAPRRLPATAAPEATAP